MMGKPTMSISIKVKCQILPSMVFLSFFNQTQCLAAGAAPHLHMGWTE